MVKHPPPQTRSLRASRSGRPIMRLLDLLGRRWTLRILWELRDGALTFRALRERCDEISPTVLNTRLKELRDDGLLDLGSAGYAQTDGGRSLLVLLAPLYDWAEDWYGPPTSGTKTRGRP